MGTVSRRERQPAFGDRRQAEQPAQFRVLDGGVLGDGDRRMQKKLLGANTGVAFAQSAQARGCVMTAVLMFVVGMAIIAGLVWVMMRMQRSHRQLIERRREEWRAGGSVGPGSRAVAAGPAAAAAG